jgi:hypothetical protein
MQTIIKEENEEKPHKHKHKNKDKHKHSHDLEEEKSETKKQIESLNKQKKINASKVEENDAQITVTAKRKSDHTATRRRSSKTCIYYSNNSTTKTLETTFIGEFD